MTAGIVRRVNTQAQPTTTHGCCVELDVVSRGGGGEWAGGRRRSRSGGEIGVQLAAEVATCMLGDWGKSSQVSFLSKKKKKKNKTKKTKKKKKGGGVDYSPLLFRHVRSNRSRLHCDHIHPRLRSVVFLLSANGRNKRKTQSEW
jgi:hypothetical protein